MRSARQARRRAVTDGRGAVGRRDAYRRRGEALSRLAAELVGRLVRVAAAAPEHEARGQQGDTAQQDRDRGEAGEGQLLLAGALRAGLDLAGGLGALVLGAGGRRCAALLLAAGRAAGLLLAENATVPVVGVPGPYCCCAALSL